MKEKLFKKVIARRLFSVVLALAMAFSLMPMTSLTAYAASNPNPTTPITIDGTDYLYDANIISISGRNLICSACNNQMIATNPPTGWVKVRSTFPICLNAGHIIVKPAHDHDWKYTVGTDADTNKIIAKCEGENDCTVTNGKTDGVTLTLTASSANYSGSPVSASLEGTTAWTAAGLTAPTIKYVGRGTTTYTESETAPTASGAYTAKITAGTATATKDFDIIPPHTHSWSYTFDNNQHWQKCASCTETQGQADHSWVRSADGSTTKCETCGAYVTVSAESGVTPKTVKDCVEVKTNLPTAPDFIVIDKVSGKQISFDTSAEGNYQAVAQVKSGVNPYADFTLTNPKTTAATGDNRPIELLVVGFAAMSVMAAAAFTMDRKRR